MGYLALILAGAGAAFLLLRGKKTGGRNPLRKKCLRALRLPDAEAEKTLNRHLMALRHKHPGRNEDWYLEKVLYDIGRDRK